MSDPSAFNQCIIKAPTNSCFLFQHWDNESVVYNNVSGETHLLERNSAELLSSIQKQSLSYNSLLNILTEMSNNLPHEELANYLDNTLTHFQELSLVDVQKGMTAGSD